MDDETKPRWADNGTDRPHEEGPTDGATPDTEPVPEIEGADIEGTEIAEVAAPPPAVEAIGVSFWYRDVIGVNDLSVTVGPGITGLLGPNGAGKSTFIKMAVGLLRPNAGHIRILGEDPWNNPGLLGRIGYVPEAPAPWQESTGREVARRAARLAGYEGAERRRRAEEVIERVGLADAATKRVSAYSHGMQQRLKFALALIADPELYILDEPLIGTDPIARRDLIHLMQELAAEGRSILLSTHVLPDVEALTDRILVVDHGRLMAHGTVSEIRDLLERYPRTVRIGTSEPRAVGAAVWGWPSVLSVHAERDALVVRTDQPVDFFPRLQRMLIDEGLPFTSVTVPDDNVEAVFRYLVG